MKIHEAKLSRLRRVLGLRSLLGFALAVTVSSGVSAAALAIGGAVTLGFFSATLRPVLDVATVGLLIATGLGTGLDT